MGVSYSEPIPDYDDTGGLVAIVLRSPNKIRVLHAPETVINAVQRVVGSVYYKRGALCAHLHGRPFVGTCGKESATNGKIFAMKIFEEMYELGYDLVTSSNLSQFQDTSTWYFRKVHSGRSKMNVMCVSPENRDKLVAVRCPHDVVSAIKILLSTYWINGYRKLKTGIVNEVEVTEFELEGAPWTDGGQSSTVSRILIMEMIKKLEKMLWKLIAVANLKGSYDSLFFMYETTSIPCSDLAIISLNRSDRLRLINFEDDVTSLVRAVILEYFQTVWPTERCYHGSYEFQLQGSPFYCQGRDAIVTRQFLCRLLEALGRKGWRIKFPIDISKKKQCKCMLLMERCQSYNLCYSCIYLSNRAELRLLDFDSNTKNLFLSKIRECYRPGISRAREKDATCYKVDLNGPAWGYNSSFSLHAKSLLLQLLNETFKCGLHFSYSADLSSRYVYYDSEPDYPVDVHSWFIYSRDNLALPELEALPPFVNNVHENDEEEEEPPSYDDYITTVF